MTGDDPAKLDQLVGFAVDGRRVDQAGGEAAGAVLQRLANENLHPGQLFARRFAVAHPHRVKTDGAMTNHAGEVDRRTVEQAEVLPESPPGPLEVGIVIQPGQMRPPLVDVGRFDRGFGEPVLTQQIGGDALAQLGAHLTVGDTSQIAVAVGVDETGRHGQPANVDDLALRHGFRTHRDDPIVRHNEVADDARIPEPIVERSAP
ncbi:MAG: hypothetical protein R2849_20660 [Thermomicrobiales bacterium]